MGKSGGTAKQTVNEYNMSIHFGVCTELDAITAIYVGEKLAWSGNVSTLSTFYLDKSDLFGGPKKEGGVRGYVTFLPGKSDQVMPNFLASRRGLSSTTHPAYRGLASVYFTGDGGGYGYYGFFGGGSGRKGFYWGATYYMQSVWIQGKRAPKGLDAEFAMIGNQVSATVNTLTYLATVGSDSATLVDSIPSTIGGYAVRLSNVVSTTGEQAWEYALNDIVITLTLDLTLDGVTYPGWSVQYDGERASLVGNSATIGGINVTFYGGVISVAFGSAGADANPIHMIYECLVEEMGATDAIIDRANFEATAKQIYHEGFGLSMIWTREQQIETFVSEILDHIQAALYLSPATGKLTIDLLRENYDITSLPNINPDNAVLDSFQRKLWGETVNEIVVTWTNPLNEQEQTVTYQDLGNIVAQGEAVSDSRNYYGIRTSELASRVAMRDVRQSSAPLASAEALLDRSQWNLKPGSVVTLTWPEYDIEQVVMRVVNIDYGKVGDPSITVNLLEDIFALDQASYNPTGVTSWIDPGLDPTPMDRSRLITAPSYFTTRALGLTDITALQYPNVYTLSLGATSNTDAVYYELVGVTTLANGSVTADRIGTRSPLGYTTLPVGFAEEATTILSAFGSVTGSVVPAPAVFMFIGDEIDAGQEIALLISQDGTTGAWTIARGLLDTVPRAWPAGTPVWLLDATQNVYDPRVHGDGEEVDYKLLTITSKGTLALADAPLTGLMMSARPHLPIRPANVVVGGVAFGPVDLSASPPSSVTVTWANRNRTMEDNTVAQWTDGTVIPETGQTTTIRLLRTDTGAVITSYTGLTGTSYSIPISAWGTEPEADVHVVSARDGFESLTGITRRVRIAYPGYGDAYGDYYGGPDTTTYPPATTPPTTTPTDPYDPGSRPSFPDFR